jgi:hypothetical protein
MSWNYRVVKRTLKPGTADEEVQFGIHSAYYHHETDLAPHSISADPAAVVAETPEELRQEVAKMMVAFGKPTLTHEAFETKENPV